MEKDILLKVDGVYSGYSGLRVIENVSLEVHPGEVVLLLGSNGAGKTTLLKTISGLLPMDGGSIFLQGNDISAMPIRDRRKHGLTYLSDETYFPTLTILENLRMSLAVHGRNPNGKKIDEVYSIFPELKERSKSKAGSLSGGQRKMLIMAMAMVSDPVLMILDEPSGGLSPVYVEKIIDSMAMRSDIPVNGSPSASISLYSSDNPGNNCYIVTSYFLFWRPLPSKQDHH